MKKNAVIIDLDGTLCDCSHRVHHMKGKKKNWVAFEAGIGDDKLNLWCAALVDAMYKIGYHIIYLTGRGAEKRKVSETWLTFHSPVPEYTLLMRKEKDWRKDFIVKKEIYDQDVAPHYNILFAIDDRKHIADMWRAAGIPCLHCADEDVGETVEQKVEPIYKLGEKEPVELASPTEEEKEWVKSFANVEEPNVFSPPPKAKIGEYESVPGDVTSEDPTTDE